MPSPSYEELTQKIRLLEQKAEKNKAVADALRLEEARLEALLELSQMSSASLQQITDFALEEAVRLTRSEIGYLAFMSQDEKTLTMHSWSKNAMVQCAVVDKPKVYPVESTGLWGEAVRQRRSVITNDYTAPNPLKRGYPKGHVCILRHMNVPVFDGSRIVAVAGVGNKAADYNDSDVRQVKLLMQGMWRLILRKWTEFELRESEAKFRQLVDTVGGAIFIYQGTKIIFANPAAESVFGYTQKELLGKKFWELMHPDYHELIKERALARQKGENVPPRYAVKILKKGGAAGWCDFTLSLIELDGRPAVLGIAFDITDRIRMEEALEESEQKFRKLSSYLLKAQENERKRISFELHDELGQSLMALKLKVGAIKRKLFPQQRRIILSCDQVHDDIDQIVENIRRLTRELSPNVLEDLGLAGAIRWLARDFAKLNHCEVTLSLGEPDHSVPLDTQITIYRIFQEALTNIGRHAGASCVSVQMAPHTDRVVLTIQDNGCGFEPTLQSAKGPSEKSLGIAAMIERARMLGAKLDIHSRIDEGTCIVLEVPFMARHKEIDAHEALSHCLGG